MKFKEEITINAPAEKIFDLYKEVNRWSSWDPDVKFSSIEGEFISGAVGTLKPTQGPKSKIIFTEIVPNQFFTVQSKLPLCVINFEHRLTESSGITKVVHQVSFTGLLAPVFGRLIGSQIKKGLPYTLQGLKNSAEQQS